MPKEYHRTRILHVTFNMGFGGTEQVIRQLVSHLDPDRYECEVACIDGEVGAIGEAMREQLGTQFHTYQRNPGFDLNAVRWLRKVIKAGNFEVVHCHQYSPYCYGWLAHWGTGVRLLFTEHGRFHPDTHRKKARLINPIMAYTTHSLIAISEATKDALVEYEYMPRSRIQVIYNGIAPLTVNPDRQRELRETLGIQPDETVIGTVARLDPVKNQPMILRAAQTLIEKGYKIRVIIVGDGPEMANLKSLASDLNIESNTNFTGFQSTPGDYLSLMDIFLLPSYTEGTSMTLLEAMSLGIPVVATRVGGTPEIVSHAETGLLIGSDNLKAFTAAIEELIDHPEMCVSMTKTSKDLFMKKLSAAVMLEAYKKNIK